MSDIGTMVTLAKDLSVITALVLALYGGATRRWVWGHHYLEAVAREQWWRDYALSLSEVADKAVGLAGRRQR